MRHRFPFLLGSTLLAATATLALSNATPLAAAEPAPKKATAKQTPAKKAEPKPPTPTLAAVRYGTHERHVLDFWRAPSDRPTPLLFFIHGGGWQGGDKSRIAAMVNVEELLAAGISAVSINYRFVSQAHAAGIKPPVQAPLEDAARALQFVRSQAAEWNIDKQRIGASGGSAGACSSLWLAFTPDRADPASADPIARESTRLWCAAVSGAQTTLDPQQMKTWTPNSRYGSHAFGIFKKVDGRDQQDFDGFLSRRDEILPWIATYSPYALVTADDPPIYLYYSAPPALGQEQKDPTHTANFGVKLQERLRAAGVPSELVYPGAPDVRHANIQAFLVATLKAPRR